MYDSDIEKHSILNDPKNKDVDITVFAKLPKIGIPTPYKTYNPDFAYLIQRRKSQKIFLIVETKGYDSEKNIPLPEKDKIKYAKKFFNALQKELPQIKIVYKTRINKENLHQLIKDIA